MRLHECRGHRGAAAPLRRDRVQTRRQVHRLRGAAVRQGPAGAGERGRDRPPARAGARAGDRARNALGRLHAGGEDVPLRAVPGLNLRPGGDRVHGRHAGSRLRRLGRGPGRDRRREQGLGWPVPMCPSRSAGGSRACRRRPSGRPRRPGGPGSRSPTRDCPGGITRSVVRLADVLVTQLPPFVCATALILASWQFNRKPFSEDAALLLSLIVLCAYSAASSVWQVRRSVQRDLVPRRRRLEALLKELDAS